jgi:hypothetical protein
MLRRLAVLVVVATLLIGATSIASAQDASPEAGPPPRDISLLRALGLPEINLVATDDAITGAPDSVEAGRYLVTLDNQSSNSEIEAYFTVLPSSVTQEQAIMDLNSNSEEIPAWVYDATWAGGPNSYSGQTDGAVVELAAGSWFITVDRSSDNDPQPVDTATALTVTEAAATPRAEMEGVVTVTAQEYAFIIPETVAAGPQIWDFVNAGEQPHFMVLWGVPDGTTMNQVMGTINSFFTGTPTADALRFEDLQDVYDTTFISGGQHQWIELDLAPGTYAAVCFFSDKETGQSHALMGMIQVFTVS